MQKLDVSSLQKLYEDLEKAKKEYTSVGERMRKDLLDIQTRIGELRKDLSNITQTTKEIYLMEHPVGSIIMNTSGINPGITYGGKWEPYAPGRVLMGISEQFSESNMTGGIEQENHTHTGFRHTHFQIEHRHIIPTHCHTFPYAHAHPQKHYHTLRKHTHLCAHNHIWIHYHIQNFGWNEEYYTYIKIPMGEHRIEESVPSEYAELSNASAISTNKFMRAYTSGPYTSIAGKEDVPVFTNTESSGSADYNFTDENREPTSYTYAETAYNEESYTSEEVIFLEESEDTVDSAPYSKVQPYITCYYYRRIE